METLLYILDQCVNGLQLGSVYALIALGYTMVYGVLRLINFAHGDVFMVGAFTGYFLLAKTKIPLFLVFFITMLVTSILGYSIEKIAYKPLRNAPRISLLITAVGVSLFLEYFLSLKQMFGPDYIAFPRPFEVKAYNLKIVSITNVQVTIFFTTFLSLVALYILVYKTKYGRAMRAISEDREVASIMGIDVDRIISFTFVVGASLAGIGGILYGIAYPQINVFMGIMPGIKSFIAAVLGGIGAIHGAVLGGLVIGVSEVFVSAFISSTLRDAFIFLILIFVLLIRPNGFFGRIVEKV
ncbi:MAG: branched-chain amino acid ABC transporter permease [Desulfobacterota bacterium]|nr:branched-chain amino acid ABC transporter permease [Thermodesulfobacteriota bacterium]MDW8001322.1 branched-chain amino acid ABC transporter permease [Deltaproteobacteria bacterium]